jgi:hypothetical protein
MTDVINDGLILWPDKETGERLDYYWKVPLDVGDVVSEATVTKTSGSVVLEGNGDHTTSKVRAWLSGGTIDEVAEFELWCRSAEGREFTVTARIRIADKAANTSPAQAHTQTLLVEARKQYHLLATGQAASAFVDQNGERVQFVKADLPALYSYIQQLERSLEPVEAKTPSRSSHPRPLRYLY